MTPDSIVPQPGNPQSLNRYSYGLNNPLRYVDPSGHDPIDSDWGRDFTTANGRAPTDDDRLDRLYSYSTGRAWTAKDWQDYTAAKKAGTVDPTWVLRGTSGTMSERIKIASGLITMMTAGPNGLKAYNEILARGTTVQFGGGPMQSKGSSIGWNNVAYLEPDLASVPAETLAANIAHEVVHAWQPVPRYPWQKSLEVPAFSQEAMVWAEVRRSYTGQTGYSSYEGSVYELRQKNYAAVMTHNIDSLFSEWPYNEPYYW